MDQKKYIAVFLPVMMINIFFVVTAVKVIRQYWNNVKDWHYWAALIGVTLIGSFIIGLVVGFFIVRRKQKGS